MTRLIDADKLLRDLVELERVLGAENADLSEHQRLATMATFGMVNALVRRSKTVDTEPVIRCRDCHHYGQTRDGSVGYCRIAGLWNNGDGFCDWAERKEE